MAADQYEANVTRNVDTQEPQTENTSTAANERMSHEAEDSSRERSNNTQRNDTQQQCAAEQNDTSFSMKGLNAYLGKLTDITTSVILDRTGNAGNSSYAERLDANRSHRMAECMRSKDKK